MVFKTFACDYDAVRGEGYLRADYSLSCTSTTHTFFEVYAYLMILVSEMPGVALNPFRSPEPLPILYPSDFVPKTGFQL